MSPGPERCLRGERPGRAKIREISSENIESIQRRTYCLVHVLYPDHNCHGIRDIDPMLWFPTPHFVDEGLELVTIPIRHVPYSVRVRIGNKNNDSRCPALSSIYLLRLLRSILTLDRDIMIKPRREIIIKLHLSFLANDFDENLRHIRDQSKRTSSWLHQAALDLRLDPAGKFEFDIRARVDILFLRVGRRTCGDDPEWFHGGNVQEGRDGVTAWVHDRTTTEIEVETDVVVFERAGWGTECRVDALDRTQDAAVNDLLRTLGSRVKANQGDSVNLTFEW